MSSVPSTSTATSASTQGTGPHSSPNPTALDRQLILRQVAMICASTQMLAETLTATYTSATDVPQPAHSVSRLDAITVANQLHSLTSTLKTLGETLLAGSATVTERLGTEGEANHNADEHNIEVDEDWEMDDENPRL